MQTTHSTGTTYQNIQKIRVAVLKINALKHPVRMKLLHAISFLENEANVTNLYVMLRMDQAVLSQHLAVLRKYKYINYRTSGKYRYYFIEMEHIEKIVNIINKFNGTGTH